MNNKFIYYKVLSELLYNSLKFRLYRFLSRPPKPEVISLAVTNRCNSHCLMCNIWKRSKEIYDIKNLELSEDEITNFLSDNFFSNLVELDLTGGEPYLREDLTEIVCEISNLKQTYLKSLRSIIITSNGYLSKQIIESSNKILNYFKSQRINDVDLVTVISIDGIGEKHDFIRGIKGAFELANSTLTGLLKLKENFSNYLIGIKTTILPYNVNGLVDIVDYAKQRDLFHIISPVLFTTARFYNLEKLSDLSLNLHEFQSLSKFYNWNDLGMDYFYYKMAEFFNNLHKQWVCTALHNYMFIDFDGRVYPCVIIPDPVGDIRKQNLKEIWFSQLVAEKRGKINNLEYCYSCNEPGAIRYSACMEGRSLFKFIICKGRAKFDKTFYNRGFYKYFRVCN